LPYRERSFYAILLFVPARSSAVEQLPFKQLVGGSIPPGRTDFMTVIIIHNIRSSHNVGSVFRSIDCLLGTQDVVVYLTGYTPNPLDKYERPNKDLSKVALGAELDIVWKIGEISEVIKEVKKQGYEVVGVELAENAQSLSSFFSNHVNSNNNGDRKKYALIFGNEVTGIESEVLALCDSVLQIDMKGNKESLNVSVCAGIVLYELSRHLKVE
jgi:23S rRNA (guanosine2251-2'-O)-methyltransferase